MKVTKNHLLSRTWHFATKTVLRLLTWISTHLIIPLTSPPSPRDNISLPIPEYPQKLISAGVEIAAKDLRLCIEKRTLPTGDVKRVLCAGHRNFREPWARDFSFASYGLLELGESDTVRETLETFLHFQTQEGQFPVKAYSIGVFDRYVHSVFRRQQPTNAPLKPKYISGHRTLSLDGNLLLVTACLHYITKTGDDRFARYYWDALRRGIKWVENHGVGRDGLISQQAYSDWEDSLALTGEVLYTNIVYWKALHEMARHAPKYGQEKEAEKWDKQAHALANKIQTHFWKADLGYFINSDELKNLSAAGNLLAVAWELATPEQGASILAAMRKFKMDIPVPTQATYGKVPLKDIALENRLAGIPEYHTHGAWLWLGAWHVIAEIYQDDIGEAQRLLELITRVVLRDRAVYEVYGLDGKPLSTYWYTADAPLTWSAGMILYAYHVYRRHLKHKHMIGDEVTA